MFTLVRPRSIPCTHRAGVTSPRRVGRLPLLQRAPSRATTFNAPQHSLHATISSCSAAPIRLPCSTVLPRSLFARTKRLIAGCHCRSCSSSLLVPNSSPAVPFVLPTQSSAPSPDTSTHQRRVPPGALHPPTKSPPQFRGHCRAEPPQAGPCRPSPPHRRPPQSAAPSAAPQSHPAVLAHRSCSRAPPCRVATPRDHVGRAHPSHHCRSPVPRW
jgi:hypothetical protein